MIVTSIINIFVTCRIPLLLSFNAEIIIIQYGGLLLIMLAVYDRDACKPVFPFGIYWCFALDAGAGIDRLYSGHYS